MTQGTQANYFLHFWMLPLKTKQRLTPIVLNLKFLPHCKSLTYKSELQTVLNPFDTLGVGPTPLIPD